MRRQKSFLLALLIAAVAVLPLLGQETPKAILDKGIELFGQDHFREALDAFGRVLSDPRSGEARAEAAYWSVLAYIAAGDRDTAFASIEAFLSAYPSSPRLPDLLYQRGRLFYAKGDFEAALKAFAAFAEAAPQSDLLPSALYWCGECLYSLGRLDEAERAFATVVDRYPASVKVEAASYRRSLIGLEYRERELLKLLTWSHEEALRSVEDFRRREKAYEQSITIYQKQLADTKRGAANDDEKTIADLRSQVADLGSRLAAAQAELSSSKAEADSLRAALAATEVTAARAESPSEASAQAVALSPDVRTEALTAKSRALDLLAFYLDKIAKEGNK